MTGEPARSSVSNSTRYNISKADALLEPRNREQYILHRIHGEILLDSTSADALQSHSEATHLCRDPLKLARILMPLLLVHELLVNVAEFG